MSFQGIADTSNSLGNHSMEEEFNFSSSSAPTGTSTMTNASISTMQSSIVNDKCITSPTSNKDQQQHSSTPPNSPGLSAPYKDSILGGGSNEAIDLQIDYWTLQSRFTDVSSNKKGDNCKFTLKNSFRNVQISRLPNFSETNSSSLTFIYITKEKKQKQSIFILILININ